MGDKEKQQNEIFYFEGRKGIIALQCFHVPFTRLADKEIMKVKDTVLSRDLIRGLHYLSWDQW